MSENLLGAGSQPRGPIMTPDNPDWKRFVALLEGPEGCNFQQDPNTEKTTWSCKGDKDKSKALAILMKHFPGVDVPATLAYFESRGGYCDCEILFNVDPDDE